MGGFLSFVPPDLPLCFLTTLTSFSSVHFYLATSCSIYLVCTIYFDSCSQWFGNPPSLVEEFNQLLILTYFCFTYPLGTTFFLLATSPIGLS
jgi:hypothetical protein